MQDGNSTQTSAIVPVYVSLPSDSDKEILIYALLDSQSNSSFILEEAVNTLHMNTEQVKLKLSTTSSKGTIVPCRKLKMESKTNKMIIMKCLYLSQDRLNLPNNKSYVVQHLMCLKKKLRKDHKFCTGCMNYMKEIITCGDAEREKKN